MSIQGETIPDQAIGRKQSGLLLEETSVGVLAGALSAGDRFDILSLNLTDTLEKIERVDKRQTANISEVVAGKRSVAWESESYVLCAAAGVAPDVDKILRGAGLQPTVDSGVSVTYAFGALEPFAILSDNEAVSQLAHGCVAETVEFSFDGTSLAKVSASGIASYSVRCGTNTLSGDEAAAQTELSVTDADFFKVGAFIQVGADNNSGDGYKITAVDTGANTITVTPALVTGASSGDAVGPCMPSGATTGNPIAGIVGDATFNSATLCVIDGTLSVANEFGSEQDKFSVQSYESSPVVTDRRVNADLTLYGKRSNFLHWVNSDSVTGAPLVITIGDTAPNRVVITMPLFVQDVENLDIPETEFVTMKITGKGLKNAGNDELSVKFY